MKGVLLICYNFLLCESDADELADAAPGSVEAFDEAEAEALRPRLEGPPPWSSWRLLWWRCLLKEDPPIERTEPPPGSKKKYLVGVPDKKSSLQEIMLYC